MTNDWIKDAAKRADEQKKREAQANGLPILNPPSALEASRAAVNGAKAPAYSTPVAKTVTVSGAAFQFGTKWKELNDLLAKYTLNYEDANDYLETSVEAYFAKDDSYADVLPVARRLAALKPEKTMLIKEHERQKIANKCMEIAKEIKDYIAMHNQRVMAEKYSDVQIENEYGQPFFINRTTLSLCEGSVRRGRHLLLVGEPGSGKTDLARLLPERVGRRVFQLDVTGLDVASELEAEQYLVNEGGATVTRRKDSQLVEALKAAEAGEKVALVIDEVARVTDPGVLNPLLLLMSHYQFHGKIAGRIYTVSPENFVIISTANVDPGRSFSGNNRRGMDDAYLDRNRIIRIPRVSADHIPAMVSARVDFTGITPGIAGNMLAAAESLYKMAQTPQQQLIITTRSIIDVVDGWVTLNPEHYSLSEVMKAVLSERVRDTATLGGLISTVENKGW